MAVQIKIQQNEHRQGEVSIPQIAAMQNLSYGAMDVEYCMIFDKVGDNYTVLYDEKSVGRGFEIWFNDGNVHISLPLPNTETDIRNAYAVAEKICAIFNVDSFVCDDEFVSLKHIPQLIENNLGASLDALQRMEEEIANNIYQSFTVLAAMNPINIGKAQIAENPAFNCSLRGDHFNKMGLYFVKDFYRFNVGTGYPACVDAYAEKVLGSEKYNCEEYKNEGYLFVPYDEKYYKGLSKYIDKEWKKYK